MTMRPATRQIERRTITVEGLEVRTANEDGSIPFIGHGAVFNKRASIAGIFEEQMSPGAFAKTIREADIRMLINHDPNLVLARTKSGTLRLSEDRKGLLTEADMSPTSYALDLAVSMQRGDVTQMSVMFAAVKDEWDESRKIPLRTVTEARLYDVSPVTFPAYEGTDASLRSSMAALTKMLGVDELRVEDRDAILIQATDGDVAPELVPVLHTMQGRIASMLERAGALPLADEHGDPTGDLPPGLPLDVYQLRMRVLARRYPIHV